MSEFFSKRILLTVAFGLLVYLYFLFITVPANMVARKVLPANMMSIISYQSVGGSIWRGFAEQVSIKKIPVGKLEWELSVLPLLWGTAGLHVTGGRDGAVLDTDATISANSMSLEQTRIELAIADLMPLIYGFPVSLDGRINAFFKSVEFKPQSHVIIEGRAVLSDIRLVAPQALSLGNLVMKFEKQDNGTRITINDQQGSVQVDAVATLAETGFYTLKGTLTPQASADVAIKNTLALFARKDAQGRYSVNTRGRIPLKF